MKWLAGGIAYACVALYMLVSLLGVVLAILVQLLSLIGIGLVGWFILRKLGGGDTEDDIKVCDEFRDKDHKT